LPTNQSFAQLIFSLPSPRDTGEREREREKEREREREAKGIFLIYKETGEKRYVENGGRVFPRSSS
jgi:hypothetical protein